MANKISPIGIKTKTFRIRERCTHYHEIEIQAPEEYTAWEIYYDADDETLNNLPSHDSEDLPECEETGEIRETTNDGN